jgi:hypothetical protein
MKTIPSTLPARALLATIALTVLLLVALALFIAWDSGHAFAPDRLGHYKLYAALLKIVLVSIGVALAVILMPAIFAESKEAFSRLKESRTCYSKAKTGLDYLPLRLCASSLQEAGALIQEVHYHKHQAELFQELHLHTRARYEKGSPLQDPEIWGDWMYRRLFKLRAALEENAATWDELSPSRRLALLRKVQPAMDALTEERAAQMDKILA